MEVTVDGVRHRIVPYSVVECCGAVTGSGQGQSAIHSRLQDKPADLKQPKSGGADFSCETILVPLPQVTNGS